MTPHSANETKSPSPADQDVGARVRGLRLVAGMSQERLGEMLGVTFQQVQKYEKGTNRISAGRLQEIAAVLNVPVAHLYGEGGELAGRAVTPRVKEGLRLMRAFGAIEDAASRRRVLALAEGLAAGGLAAGQDADGGAPSAAGG